jgi:hypothetical protein
LVEAIVAEALPSEWTWNSTEWASADFVHRRGIRLEVKQSAALRTWNAASRRASRPSFDIAPRRGEYVGETWVERAGRNAETYVFAYHPVMTADADHREPAQWLFYVVPERRLPMGQRTIALSQIRRLTDSSEYSRLGPAVADALSELKSAE